MEKGFYSPLYTPSAVFIPTRRNTLCGAAAVDIFWREDYINYKGMFLMLKLFTTIFAV